MTTGNRNFRRSGVSYVNTVGAARNHRELQALVSAMTSRPGFGKELRCLKRGSFLVICPYNMPATEGAE